MVSVEQTNVSHMGCISQKNLAESPRFVSFSAFSGRPRQTATKALVLVAHSLGAAAIHKKRQTSESGQQYVVARKETQLRELVSSCLAFCFREKGKSRGAKALRK